MVCGALSSKLEVSERREHKEFRVFRVSLFTVSSLGEWLV